MQKEQLVTVTNHAALVFELGSREVKSAWWMRTRDGTPGLEAMKPDGGMVRIELVEPDADDTPQH